MEMRKHSLVIMGAVIFICVNVATFFFARGRIEIVEKIVMVYEKRNEAPEEVLAAGGATERANAGIGASRITPVIVEAYHRDLDYADHGIADSGYILEAGEDSYEEYPEQDARAEKEDTGDTSETNETNEVFAGSSNIPAQSALASLPDNINGWDTRVADETVPLPQLPLFDTDFEVYGDDGGLENVALPELPDIVLN